MRRVVLIASIVCGAALMGAQVRAQAPAAPPPSGGTADGGWPLVESGKLIGAIGCSGGTGDQDAAACKAGADLVK